MTVRELIKSLKFVKRRIGDVKVFIAGCDHNGDYLTCPLSENGIICNADGSITIDVLIQSATLKEKQYKGASTKEEKINALIEYCNDHFNGNCYSCNLDGLLPNCGSMVFMNRLSDKGVDVLYAKICGEEEKAKEIMRSEENA